MSRAADVEIVPMHPVDAEAVAAIEALSEAHPTSAAAYRRELASNPNAAYYVARLTAAGVDWRPEVVGFAGLWMQHDEAHITMIAVHPIWRRRGISRRLLARLLEHALARRATLVTLEVRAENQAALALYERFGFLYTGDRRAYFPGDRADALIMSTPALSDPAWRAEFERLLARLREDAKD